MSILEVLGYTDEQLFFSKIPEERIKHPAMMFRFLLKMKKTKKFCGKHMDWNKLQQGS